MTLRSTLLTLLVCVPVLTACSAAPGATDSPDAGIELPKPPVDPDPLSPKPGPTPTATCRADGWCWENPFPQGNDIQAMWVGSERDAWAGGANGLLMHWNGTDWKEWSSGSLATITSLSGSGPADLWAIAEREKIH